MTVTFKIGRHLLRGFVTILKSGLRWNPRLQSFRKKSKRWRATQVSRNKKLITAFIVAVVLTAVCYILSNSQINGALSFHRVLNQRTGVQISIIGSVALYLLFWLFSGMVPSSTAFLMAMFFYWFLHRKDPRFFERGYIPPYEDELHFAWKVSFIVTYAAALFLILLQISNLVNVHVLPSL